jgi:SAM-dependent methyltransferase
MSASPPVAAEATPLCPVTGQPAVRRVQWVPSRLLIDLWRITFGVDARGSFAGRERFGLWESPTGLYFFDPPREGDHQFYSDLYAGLKRRGFISVETVRPEFLMAARRIPAGARVLDVGCGLGGFRACVPEADYTGLDPHMAAHALIADVRSETLRQHLDGNAGAYDAVCCFEVIEHVPDPKALFAELVQAARPGGLVCVSVPRVPSAMTRIPNFLINAPPHHLTWWTEAALRHLAKSAGAEVMSVEHVPFGSDSGIYWIERFSPIKCRDVHFRGAFGWHAASLVSSLLGIAASRIFRVPRMDRDDGIGLVMIARRPGAAA